MRLLQLNATANWGSTGHIAEGISQAASARGWECVTAFGRYECPSDFEKWKVGSYPWTLMHYAQSRFLDSEGHGSSLPTNNLISKIKSWKPDIIQLHNIHDHWLNYPKLFDYLSEINTPVVWTFHDCWAMTGGCMHPVIYECDKWKTTCYSCPAWKHGRSTRNHELRKKLFLKIRNRLTIVPVSAWMEQNVHDSFLKDCRVQKISNGIDIEKFIPTKTEKQKLVIGVSNVWNESKGLNDFYQLRKLLSPDWQIRLIGLKKGQIKSLPEGIQGMERTQNLSELVRCYSQAYALVNPTYADTFPTVNLEAQACGTPVVGYNTGGCPETINPFTGKIVEKGDVKALAEGVLSLSASPAECRKWVVENFDKNVQFSKYIDLYQSLL